MENPKELIKSGEIDLENICFSYFIIKKEKSVQKTPYLSIISHLFRFVKFIPVVAPVRKHNWRANKWIFFANFTFQISLP